MRKLPEVGGTLRLRLCRPAASYVKFSVSSLTRRSNISLRVEGQKTAVFLRGPQGTTWTFLNSYHMKFMVSMHKTQ